MIASGKPADALALLDTATTADALSTKAEAAIKAGQPTVAATTYAAFAQKSGKNDPGLLHLLGREYLLVSRPRQDLPASVDACDALIPAGLFADAGCGPDARKLFADTTQSQSPRLRAGAILLRSGDTSVSREFSALARTAESTAARRALAGQLRGVPSTVAVPLLVPMLGDEDLGLQFTAASVLGTFPTLDAKEALRRYLRITDRRIARVAAQLALALLGDAPAIAAVAESLDDFGGSDLLAAGLALKAVGNPKGTAALLRVANGEDDSLRLEAAAALAGSHGILASAAFSSGLSSPNPLLRAATFREFRSTKLLTPAALVSGLGDPAAEVRTEAALGLVTQYQAAPTPVRRGSRAARP